MGVRVDGTWQQAVEQEAERSHHAESDLEVHPALPTSDVLPKGSFPTGAMNWGPCVQIRELIQDISHPSQHSQ